MEKEKKKKGFMDNYKTYDPSTEGYGSASEWRRSFKAKMGLDEATNIMKLRSPYDILGLALDATLAQAKAAFRKLAMEYHPDRNNGSKESHDKMQVIIAAWTILQTKLK